MGAMSLEIFKQTATVNSQLEDARKRLVAIRKELSSRAVKEAKETFPTFFAKEGFKISEAAGRVVATFEGTQIVLILPKPGEYPIGALVRFTIAKGTYPGVTVIAVPTRKSSVSTDEKKGTSGNAELDEATANLAKALEEEATLQSATLGYKSLREDSKLNFPDRPTWTSFEKVIEDFMN